ncbi:hypothetical protein AXO1947_07130 [Xanthomonas oryzae pv. oryzae]|nr:hypothetical protein AXO1947_07130 [Xanthomonas oryzae pv. oryzae]
MSTPTARRFWMRFRIVARMRRPLHAAQYPSSPWSHLIADFADANFCCTRKAPEGQIERRPQ